MSFTAPEDAFLDVNDAHLRVYGNVHADGLKLGQLEIVTTTSTGSTIQFLHQHTAFTTTSNIEVGTTNHDLFVDTKNSRVGILTNTPTTALDVNGTVKATAFDGNGALLTGIPSSAINGTLSQWTTVTGPKIHYSDGNVGIGIADPLHTLDVVGDINFTGTLREDGNPFVSTPWTIESGPTALSYTLGNVGIGAVTPSAKLEVTGNAHVSTDLSVGGNLTINTISAAATHGLGAVTALSNTSADTVLLTNTGTSLVASGSIDVSGVVGTSGTGALTVPSGTTAEQPTGVAGMIRFNTENDILEHYTSSGWRTIVSAPIITSFSGVINENVSSTLIIHGLYFSSGCIVSIKGSAVSGTERSLVTTFVNSNKVTVNTDASSSNYVSGASYDIKIVNSDGNEFTLTPAGVVDATPTWTTLAGNIGEYYDWTALRGHFLTISYQLLASDSDNDDDSITYSLTSGTLPPGVYVSTSGLISGDPDEVTSDTTYPFGISIISNSIAVERSFNFLIKRRYGLTSDRAATSVDQFHPTLDSNGLYYMDIGIGAGTQQYFVDFNMVGGPYVMIARNMGSQTGNSATFGIQNTGSTAGNYTDTGHFNTNITGINPTVYVVRNNYTYYAKFDLDTSSRNAIYAELQDTAGETSNSTNANTGFTIPSGGVYRADGTYVNTWTSSPAIIELHHGGWNTTSNINYIIEVGTNTRTKGSGGSGTYTGFSSQGRIILKGDGTRSLGDIDYHFIRI